MLRCSPNVDNNGVFADVEVLVLIYQYLYVAVGTSTAALLVLNSSIHIIIHQLHTVAITLLSQPNIK